MCQLRGRYGQMPCSLDVRKSRQSGNISFIEVWMNLRMFLKWRRMEKVLQTAVQI